MAETTDTSATAPTPGSVAHEAAMLVDLLARQGWAGGETTGARHHEDPPPATEAGTGPGTGRSECTCGGTTPSACRICPVCQLISFVKQVSPETIDRVAEVVDLAATALRDLAQGQRDRQGTSPETAAEPDAPPPDGRMGP